MYTELCCAAAQPRGAWIRAAAAAAAAVLLAAPPPLRHPAYLQVAKGTPPGREVSSESIAAQVQALQLAQLAPLRGQRACKRVKGRCHGGPGALHALVQPRWATTPTCLHACIRKRAALLQRQQTSMARPGRSSISTHPPSSWLPPSEMCWMVASWLISRGSRPVRPVFFRFRFCRRPGRGHSLIHDHMTEQQGPSGGRSRGALIQAASSSLPPSPPAGSPACSRAWRRSAAARRPGACPSARCRRERGGDGWGCGGSADAVHAQQGRQGSCRQAGRQPAYARTACSSSSSSSSASDVRPPPPPPSPCRHPRSHLLHEALRVAGEPLPDAIIGAAVPRARTLREEPCGIYGGDKAQQLLQLVLFGGGCRACRQAWELGGDGRAEGGGSERGGSVRDGGGGGGRAAGVGGVAQRAERKDGWARALLVGRWQE